MPNAAAMAFAQASGRGAGLGPSLWDRRFQMRRGDVLIDRALGVDPGEQLQELDMFGGGARDGEVRVAAAIDLAVPGLVAQRAGSAVAAGAPAAGGGQARAVAAA